MILRKFAVRRMNCSFRWRQGEDLPPMPDIDRAKSKYIGEECAVRFRITAIEKNVRAKKHAGQYMT